MVQCSGSESHLSQAGSSGHPSFFKKSVWLDLLTKFLENNNIKAIILYPMRTNLGNARWINAQTQWYKRDKLLQSDKTNKRNLFYYHYYSTNLLVCSLQYHGILSECRNLYILNKNVNVSTSSTMYVQLIFCFFLLYFKGKGGWYDIVKGTDVHESSRSDSCKGRFNSTTFSKLFVMNRKLGFPGKEIYYSGI